MEINSIANPNSPLSLPSTESLNAPTFMTWLSFSIDDEFIRRCFILGPNDSENVTSEFKNTMNDIMSRIGFTFEGDNLEYTPALPLIYTKGNGDPNKKNKNKFKKKYINWIT